MLIFLRVETIVDVSHLRPLMLIFLMLVTSPDSEAIPETIQHRMSNYRVIVVYFEEYCMCFNFAQIENTNALRKI
jgi:hypothetical protein